MAFCATARAEEEPFTGGAVAGWVGVGRRRAQRSHEPGYCCQLGVWQGERRHSCRRNAIADYGAQFVECTRSDAAVIGEVRSAFGAAAVYAMAHRAARGESLPAILRQSDGAYQQNVTSDGPHIFSVGFSFDRLNRTGERHRAPGGIVIAFSVDEK